MSADNGIGLNLFQNEPCPGHLDNLERKDIPSNPTLKSIVGEHR
jgi:hypothetical protein